MRDYFKGVDFPELENNEPEVVQNADDPLVKATTVQKRGGSKQPRADVDITAIMTEVRRMITAIESGQSQIVKGAIRLGDAPVMQALHYLEQTPSMVTLRAFLRIAEQDINLRFRREVVNMFKQQKVLGEILKEHNIE